MCFGCWSRRGYKRLDTLFRFHAHDNDAERGIVWLVSSGGLEGQRRHYRVMYNGGEMLDNELTIDIDSDETIALTQFLASCREILDMPVSAAFQTAIRSMIATDPWLRG
jgi:hypothetical protein